MRQSGIFAGRTRIAYPYAGFGFTRGGGRVWHGGLDLVGLDDATVRMPYYKGKQITGRVTRARIVTDRQNRTWEWGWYVCVQLDRAQTPDAVNFLYFAHCARLLVKAGQRVASGDALGVMGNTGNAALADPPYPHCHFEVRAAANGTGLDWVSGSAAAACRGQWSSAAARAGIWHKAGMVVVVLVSALTDGVLGMAVANLPGLGLQPNGVVLPVVLVWYIFTELGSIAENAAAMGAPVPAWLVKLLAEGKEGADK